MHVPRSNRKRSSNITNITTTGSRSVLTHHNVDSPRSSSRRIPRLAGAVAAVVVVGTPVAGFMVPPAQAQASISVQFRTALQDHGRWPRHSRWGEVWIRANAGLYLM